MITLDTPDGPLQVSEKVAIWLKSSAGQDQIRFAIHRARGSIVRKTDSDRPKVDGETLTDGTQK